VLVFLLVLVLVLVLLGRCLGLNLDGHTRHGS
jgi:hypothetical protein